MQHRVRNFVLQAAYPCLIMWLLACTFSFCLFFVSGARAQTLSLKIYYVHTNERAEIVFKKNGRYVNSGLKRLNYLLRDWRRNEPTKLDPRLFDLVWQVYRLSGSRDYIHVISAYRSPQTNNMLRARSVNSGVAKNSQHMLGKALDFYMPDVSLVRLREIGLKQQAGGVGYYPGSGSPFVHMDVGNVRHWPRMSRSELMALFPDGKTMHVPGDGRPLANYAQAVAEYKARAGQPAQMMAAKADGSKSGSGGLFSSLFKDRHDNMTGMRQPVGNASSVSGVQIAALPTDDVPVPDVLPLHAMSGAGTAEKGEMSVIMAYAPETVVPASVPVPGVKPAEQTMAEKPAADKGHMVAAIAPLHIPVPVQRESVEEEMYEEDEIAVAIRQSGFMAAFTGEHSPASVPDEIGALIAQDNFIPLPEEDEEAHDDVLPGKDDRDVAQGFMPGLPADHRMVAAVDVVTTLKTSKARIGEPAGGAAHADNRHESQGGTVSLTDELKQVPDMIFALGLQKIRGRPEVARLSGSAVNFHSIARIVSDY